MAEKNMAVALVLSFIITGLGIIYAGDVKKGVIFIAAAVILNILGFLVAGIFSFIAILVWIYALYATYKEVRAVNGA